MLLVGGMMYPSIKAATIAVLDEAAALKFALGNIADKLIVAAEKINGTAIGKAVSKVEAALLEQEAKLLGKFGLGAAAEAQVARTEEHAVEELVLADSGIRIKVNRDVEKEVSALSKTAAIVPDKKRAMQAVKVETASLQPTREKMLPKMKTYDEARNKASEIIGEVDPHSAVPHIEELYTCKDKLCGLKWEKNKVVMRLDYDPIKGPHINVADFRRAIGDDKFAIPFESDEKTIKSLLKHLNTKSSLEKAKMIYVESKNEKDLIRITGMIENLNKKRSKYEKRF